MKFQLPDKLTFVDIETTGCHPQKDRIIEIGILRVEDNTLVQSYQTLLNPQTHISPFIEDLTGIKATDLEQAPLFEDIHHELFDILDESVFVAHNVRFDYGFIRNEFLRLGKKFSADHFCTARLSKSLYPQYSRHNLDELMHRFGFVCESRHRAFDDAKVLWDFYQLVQKQIDKEHLIKAVMIGLKKPTIPINLNESVLKDIPDCPGVYIFYGQNGMPIYVGKSKHLHDRVCSHFSADYLSSKDMKLSQQVFSIEIRETAGELGALLLESKLVKQLMPIYNRMLRKARTLILLKRTQNEDGYYTISIGEALEVKPDEIPDIMGVFRSKLQAIDFLVNITKEHRLCQKLLGLEKSAKSCFGYQLKTCKGACLGKEKPASYNVRLMDALSKTKLHSWPFGGPIEIIEENEELNRKDVFLIDNWCIVKTTVFNGEVKTDAFQKKLDVDVYRILKRHVYRTQSYIHSHSA